MKKLEKSLEWDEKNEETSRVIWEDDKEVPLEAEPQKGDTVIDIWILTIFILFSFIFLILLFFFFILFSWKDDEEGT